MDFEVHPPAWFVPSIQFYERARGTLSVRAEGLAARRVQGVGDVVVVVRRQESLALSVGLPMSCSGACLILLRGGRGKPWLLSEAGVQDRWTGCRGLLISTLASGPGVLCGRLLLLQPPPGLPGSCQAAQQYRGVGEDP